MSTRRERREARAGRLREWANKRETSADAKFARADAIAERFAGGQPILVGHHSEAGARRDQKRITASMLGGFADQEKADGMRERAKNIEAANARAIYDDDPDAIERLTAKLAQLEAERDRIKAYNRSCRAAARTGAKAGDLSLLDEDQKADVLAIARHCRDHLGKHGEMPSYALSNLARTIRVTRKRLEKLKRVRT